MTQVLKCLTLAAIAAFFVSGVTSAALAESSPIKGYNLSLQSVRFKAVTSKDITIRVQVALPSNKSRSFFALDSVASISRQLPVATSFKGTSKIAIDMQQLKNLQRNFSTAQLGLQINVSLNRSWLQQLASDAEAGFLVLGRGSMILQATNFLPDSSSRGFDPSMQPFDVSGHSTFTVENDTVEVVFAVDQVGDPVVD